MRSLSHVVPTAVLAASLFGGCYLAHGGDPSPLADASSPRDGGTRPDAAVRPDGGLRPRDAGLPLDAGLRCAPTRADFACLESFRVEPGEPFVLPLTLDACGCCPQAECAVSVDEPARTLRALTTLCPDLCDCLACNTSVARCEVPALSSGAWTVEVNGAVAMWLPVFEDSGRGPPPACVDFAEADECTGSRALDGRAQPVVRACVRLHEGRQQYELVLDDDCGTCDREGPCIVTAEPRLTDDLPPGTELRVDARRFSGACDGACPPVCIETTRTCLVPPLAPGEVHRVFVGGLPPFTFVSGSDREVCSGG